MPVGLFAQSYKDDLSLRLLTGGKQRRVGTAKDIQSIFLHGKFQYFTKSGKIIS